MDSDAFSSYSSDSELHRRVIALLSDERGIRPDRIQLDSRLAQDLGMDGDDAVEFFESFARQFSVDMSSIRWDTHFGPEGCNPFALLLPSFWRWRRECRAITVQQLISAAQSHRWNFDYDTHAIRNDRNA